MSNYSPYITRDIQLNRLGLQEGFPLIKEAGYYCVFWWLDIPLGQLFIEKNQEPTTEELFKNVFSVIHPAIDFYADSRKIERSDYKKTFFENDWRNFNREMDKIFSAFLPQAFPQAIDISVVICTRNRSVHLKNCLERLKSQRSLPGEIIVVDNAPSDESTRIVADQFPGVVYCRELRAGLDIARNAGAKLAKNDIVAYIDDDVLVHPLWAYRTWEAFLSKDVIATTGLVIASSLETEAQQIFEKFWSFNRGYQDKVYAGNFFDKQLAEGPPVWEIGAGANMAFRKSLFDRVGYFDERLDVGAAGCSGDSEIWFRILADGGNIHYSPRSVVYHEHRKELQQLHKQLFNYMRGFAAAALIQQAHYKQANYKKRLFQSLPKNYFQMLVHAFPRYSFQNRTLISEIRGVVSGIFFYYKNKNKPS